MSHRIITANTTVDEADSNIYLVVQDTATITIPKDKFLEGDEIFVYRDTTNVVDIVAATGVTINSIGVNVGECQLATFVKIDTNLWIGYGDLS